MNRQLRRPTSHVRRPSSNRSARRKSLDILTFGDLCVDLIVSGRDVTPAFGQAEKVVEEYALEMGGSTSIFACQAAKLGLATAIVGAIGADPFGDLIRDTLKRAGVSLKHLRLDPAAQTGLSVILNRRRERAIMTCLGTIDAVRPEHTPDSLLRSVGHFHIGSYYLMPSIRPHYPAIVARLKKFGATISLDTNWDPEEKWEGGLRKLMPMIDVFLPNENEALAIARESNLDRAGKKLAAIVPVVAIKRGKRGASVFSGRERIDVKTAPVKVVDAVGAGDSFDAGFLLGFLSGRDLEASARIGCFCGARNTTQPGGTRGQPDLRQVLAML